MSSSRNLQSAYKLMEQGQKKEAAALVREVLAENKNDANAWWLMSLLLEDEDKKVKALERVLSIKPDHQAARAKLRELRPERQTGEIGKNMMATQEIMNLDWSKLKDDPHPDKRKPKESVDKDQKVATYAMMMLGGFILLVIIIAAGLFVMDYLNQPDKSPDEVVYAYLEAVGRLDFDQVASLTCEQYRGDVETAGRQFRSMLNGASVEDISLDFSGLTASIVDKTETTATVAVGGSFVMSVPGFDMTFDMDELSGMLGDDANVSLVLENNGWRICEAS